MSTATQHDLSSNPPRPDDHHDPAWGTVRRSGPRGGVSPPPSRPLLARFLILLLRSVGKLPLRLIHAIGAAGGALVSLLPLRAKYYAKVNLSIAYPDADRRNRDQLVRRSLMHTGRTMLELAAVWTWDRQRLLDTVVTVNGKELIDEAVADGRGVILAAPHLGPWELVLMYCSAHWPMTTLYRPLRIRELEGFVQQARERFGAHMMPAGNRAVRALRTALGRGEMSAIAPDQDAGEGGGVFVPFFGVLANTMVFLPRLVQSSGARVVMAYARRLPRGAGFHLQFLPPPDAIYDPDLAVAAAALNQAIERLIQQSSEQYMWCYDRYRIRPTTDETLYPERHRYV